jgi:[acyl-carrier-protein] S-malonyltransferase
MQAMPFNAPQVPVIQNVNVASSEDVEQIKTLLKEQLYSPVRWVETVQTMAATGVDTLIEAGPGKVLSGLSKRIDKQLSALPVFDGASLDKALETVNG